MPRLSTSRVSAAALLALAGAAQAQITAPSLLAGNDPAGGVSIAVFDVNSGAFTSTIPAALRITGMTYDQAARRVYISARGASATQSTLHVLDVSDAAAPVGPTFVVNVSNPTNQTSGAIAWDNANNRLLSTFLGNIYSVDVSTGVSTLLRNFGSGVSLNGADIDPVSGAMYVVHNSTGGTAPFFGRGVYRIDPPIESGAVVKIAEFPTRADLTPETDIDGLAVGGGIVYLNTDESAGLYRLDLATGQYLTPVAQPFATSGAVSGLALVPTASAGADLGVSIRVDDAASAPAGQATYVVSVRNLGAGVATGSSVSVPLPGTTTFASATGGATLSGSSVVLALGDLGPNAGATFTFTVNLPGPGTYGATATASTTALDAWTGNNSASASARRPTATDLTLSATGPAACGAGVGGAAEFTFTVGNGGDQAATGVVLAVTVPAGATYSASTPPATVSGNVATIVIGSVAAGASVAVPVTLTPTAGGNLIAAGAVSAVSAETDPTDNSASASFLVDSFSPATAAARGLLSSIAGANNDVPGVPGSIFPAPSTLPSIGTVHRSSNGQWLISRWDTDTGASTNNVLIRTNLLTGVSDLVVREGVTVIPTTPAGIAQNNFALSYSINDSGEVSFSGDTDQATTVDNYVAKFSAGTITVIAQEGQPTGTPLGGVWGSGVGSSRIANSGNVSFVGNIPALPSGQQEFGFLASGLISTVQTGVSVPTDAGAPLNDIFNGSDAQGFFSAANGIDWVLSGVRPSSIDVAVVGSGASAGRAVVEEGEAVPGSGFATVVSAIEAVQISPEGRWFVRGSNSDGQDWVYSGVNAAATGTIIARSGDPIVPGSSELWTAATSSSNLFFASVGNPRGDYLVGGEVQGAPGQFSQVLVLNGTTIVARESDPVDVNGDGVFNDDTYFRDFGVGDDRLVMTDDAVYVQARFRGRTVVCGAADASFSEYGLVRIPLPAVSVNVACCRGSTCATVPAAECTPTASPVVGAGVSPASSCGVQNSATAGCCVADFNKLGGVTIDDIFIYLNAWFASSEFANVGEPGTPNIDDIFVFLNAWFAGC